MDHRTRIIEAIEKVSRKRVSVQDSESLFDCGILDSFTLPDLVAALERDFSVRVPDRDLLPQKFESVERIERYFTQA